MQKSWGKGDISFMSVSESQLQSWSNQGATASASTIYERVRRALKSDATLSAYNFDIFLQGSYRNSTNIRGDSDVDVVVRLNVASTPNHNLLANFITNRSRSTDYGLTNFRHDVSNAISRAFPTHKITQGSKSIKIPRTANNIPTDVVPCLEYPLNDVFHTNGIWLQDMQRNQPIISFPIQSYENGVAKHNRTNQWYKPTVRLFKNARGWMEDNQLIRSGTASSHAIECLLYNVPDQYFGHSYTDTFINVVNWLNGTDLTSFICQNGIQWLFEPGRWTTQDARKYIGGLVQI